MGKIVLIDDVRVFRDLRECLVATTPSAGVALLRTLQHERIDELWLDHDLGGDLKIWPVVHLLENEAHAGRRWDIGVVKVHAQGSGPAYEIGVSLRRAGYPTERISDLSVFRWRTAAPEDDASEAFHQQMFDLSLAPNGFVRWKIQTTGVEIARGLAAARQRGRADWVARYGELPEAWLLTHPPLVLWMPQVASPACVRCRWIGSSTSSPDQAADAARQHALERQDPAQGGSDLQWEPLQVWRRDGQWDPPGPEWAVGNVSGARENGVEGESSECS